MSILWLQGQDNLFEICKFYCTFFSFFRLYFMFWVFRCSIYLRTWPVNGCYIRDVFGNEGQTWLPSVIHTWLLAGIWQTTTSTLTIRKHLSVIIIQNPLTVRKITKLDNCHVVINFGNNTFNTPQQTFRIAVKCLFASLF